MFTTYVIVCAAQPDLGFDWISMDDGWQQCNCSTRQDEDPSLPKCPNLCFPSDSCTFHDAQGAPMVRKDRFQDMKALVDKGHSLGLKVGTHAPPLELFFVLFALALALLPHERAPLLL